MIWDELAIQNSVPENRYCGGRKRYSYGIIRVPTNLRTPFPSSAPAPDYEDSDDDGSSATMIEYAGWSIFSFALMTIMQ